LCGTLTENESNSLQMYLRSSPAGLKDYKKNEAFWVCHGFFIHDTHLEPDWTLSYGLKLELRTVHRGLCSTLINRCNPRRRLRTL